MRYSHDPMSDTAVRRHCIGVAIIGGDGGTLRDLSGLRPMRPDREAEVQRWIQLNTARLHNIQGVTRDGGSRTA